MTFMSSPKAAVAKAPRRPKAAAPPAADAALSDAATRLAAAIERELAEGRQDMLTTGAFQSLMGALCRTYAAQIEAGHETLPLQERGSVANTDVMIMASAL